MESSNTQKGVETFTSEITSLSSPKNYSSRYERNSKCQTKDSGDERTSISTKCSSVEHVGLVFLERRKSSQMENDMCIIVAIGMEESDPASKNISMRKC